MKVTFLNGCQESPGTHAVPCWEAKQEPLQQCGQQGVQAILRLCHLWWGGRWEAPQGTSPTPVLLTPQQGQRKCHSMGVSAPCISSRTFQHCASTSNEAPSLPWSPQTSPAPPACYVFSHRVAFVSWSTLSSVSSRSLHIVAGVRPSLLYLISLASKLTQQKNTLAGKKPSESTGEVRAKGAWKNVALSPVLSAGKLKEEDCLHFKVNPVSRWEAPLSTALSQNILFFP